MQKIAPKSVYYDNNAYRMPKAIYEKVAARERALGIVGIASPYVIRELICHLSGDRLADEFLIAMSALRRMREHCRTGKKTRMYSTMEEIITMAVFNSKTLTDDNRCAEMARVLRMVTETPSDEWSENLCEVLAAYAKQRRELDDMYLLHHSETVAMGDAIPTLADMFRPVETERQGVTVTKVLIAKSYGLSGDVLDTEARRHAPFYVAAIKEAGARSVRIGPRLMADYMAQLHGGHLTDENREMAVDMLLADFPVPFAHQDLYARGAIKGANADPNDFTDRMLTWQIPPRMVREPKSPPVLITSDAGILRAAADCPTIMSQVDYLDFLEVDPTT